MNNKSILPKKNQKQKQKNKINNKREQKTRKSYKIQ